jgi:hypothetical protein
MLFVRFVPSEMLHIFLWAQVSSKKADEEMEEEEDEG